MASLTCISCGAGFDQRVSRGRKLQMCGPCASSHFLEREAATRQVLREKYHGRMQKASAHTCVDCGSQAEHWDHRDYTKPLDVVPVCRSCNFKRPTAFNSMYRPAGEQAAQPN